MFQTADHQINVFFTVQYGKLPSLIISSQICTGKYMEKLKLDPLDLTSVQVLHGVKHIPGGLPRKSQNGMYDHIQACLMKALHGLVKTGKRITSADISGSVLVDGLKTKFYPHRLDLIQPGKQPNHRLFQTVRSGADGYGTDIRVLDGFGKYSLQIFYRSIGVGVSLKIGDVFVDSACLVEAGKAADTIFEEDPELESEKYAPLKRRITVNLSENSEQIIL